MIQIALAAATLIVCLLSTLPTLAKAQPKIIWPVTFAKPWTKLSSTFGPRLQASQNYRYDFHRGIDIPGDATDAVVAVEDGTVFRIYQADDTTSPYYSSGTVVIVRHQLPSPWQWHNQNQHVYYSLYMHLSTIVDGIAVGTAVQAGDTLGYIGQSGSTDFTHLHFEVRVGTTCSLASDCNTVGFDPHLHPLTFLSYPETNRLGVRFTQRRQRLHVRLKIPKQELDVNRIVLTTYDDAGHALKTKKLNFNSREGVNPASTATLDDASYAGITIRPKRFSEETPYEILNVWFSGLMSNQVKSARAEIFDVHGHRLVKKILTL